MTEPQSASSPARVDPPLIPSADEPQAKHAIQNKMIESYISSAEKFMSIALTDAEIRPVLEQHGFDAEEQAAGNLLIEAARKAFQDRALGLGGKSEAGEDLGEKIQSARRHYGAFREIARACYPASAHRLALSLSGDLPDDTGRFITTATASYNAASLDPYKAKLTKRSYSPARLTELLSELKQLTNSAADKTGADGSAINRTAARDRAYEELKTYMKELKGVARGAFRGKPGALKKLGLA